MSVPSWTKELQVIFPPKWKTAAPPVDSTAGQSEPLRVLLIPRFHKEFWSGMEILPEKDVFIPIKQKEIC